MGGMKKPGLGWPGGRLQTTGSAASPQLRRCWQAVAATQASVHRGGSIWAFAVSRGNGHYFSPYPEVSRVFREL